MAKSNSVTYHHVPVLQGTIPNRKAPLSASWLSRTQKSLLKQVLAIVLSTFMAAFVLGLPFYTITISKAADFSSIQQTIYAMCLALAATGCQRLIIGVLQSSLLVWAHPSILNASLSGENTQSGHMRAANARWRTAMRVSSVTQSLQNIGIYSSYLVGALITAAIVSACTASKTKKTATLQTSLPSGAPDNCLRVLDQLDDNYYQWNIGNGSYYSIQPSMDSCPTRQAISLAGTINTVNPTLFAYADIGVAVDPSAIGAPTTIYSPYKDRAPALSASFQASADGLVKIEQCAPVLIQNPVTCRPGGTINPNDTHMLITSDDGQCSYGRDWPADLNTYLYPAVQNALCVNNAVGRATIIMSALYGWGHTLAQTVNDQQYLQSHSRGGDRDGYILTCHVDISSAIDTQYLSLHMSNYDPSGSGYSKKLNSTG